MSKLDSVNLLEPLSQSQEVDLVEAEICRKETVEGMIGGTPSNGILLDTGACRTVVNDKLVQPEWYTGKTWRVRAFDGPVKRYSLAKVMVKVDRFEKEMEVMVAGMDYDALLGKDVPGLWVLGKRLLYDNLINMVSTQSRKADLQRTAGDHPDPESDDGDSGKSSSEEEMDTSGTDRPWVGVPNEPGEVEWSEVSKSSDEETKDMSTRVERRRARKVYVSNWPGHPMDVDRATLRKWQTEDGRQKRGQRVPH